MRQDSPSIRLAVPAEHQALGALMMRASMADQGDHEALLARADEVSLPIGQISASQVFVAELGGGLVGFASVVFRQDGDIELDGLFIEPEVWNSGVGRLLVAECGKFARNVGAHALRITGNPGAEKFYIACGFEILGIAKTPFGPGLRMRMSV